MIHLHRIVVFLSMITSSIHGTASSGVLHYISSSCQTKDEGSLDSMFRTNLNDTLFNQLLPKASTLGFYNFTNGKTVDQVYALFYCKADIDNQTCHDCVQAATRKITDVCKFHKEGTVWFEECTLRYANRRIFGIDEVVPYYVYYNYTGILNDYRLDPYQDRFDSTMGSVIRDAAYSNGTFQGFATDEFSISSTEIIRGLAQCTPDIVGPRCYKCLTTALRLRDAWANTKVFLPSCFLRYDFYGTEPSQPLSPTPAPAPQLSLPPQAPPWYYALYVLASFVVMHLLHCIAAPWLYPKDCPQEYELVPTGRDVIEEQPVPNLLNDVETRTLNGIQEQPVPKHPNAGEERTQHGFRKYTYSQLEEMTDMFTKKIGKGALRDVYYGLLLDGSREVAIKVLLIEEDAPKQFNSEIDMFGRISHKNLVSLLGYCEDGTKLALIYELMDKRDLRAYLAGSVSWTKRLEIAIGTAEGLYYLHNHCEEHIVHGDVKPDNILLTGEGELLQAKVSGFGFNKIFAAAEVTSLATRIEGSHGYTAPEYYSTCLSNEKGDVYSFGVVLLDLITGISPCRGLDSVNYFETMLSTGDIDRVLDRMVSRDLNYGSVWGAIGLARLCVEKDEKKRPDMLNILVKLKQCLELEIHKDTGNSSAASTSIEMMSAKSITTPPSYQITIVPEA